MHCIWCGINRNYYLTEENASRQNCRESDNGYHDFVSFPWLYRVLDCLNVRTRSHPLGEDLIRRRREMRPNTI